MQHTRLVKTLELLDKMMGKVSGEISVEVRASMIAQTYEFFKDCEKHRRERDGLSLINSSHGFQR